MRYAPPTSTGFPVSHKPQRASSGFTLLELSIVLVVISLLTGAVMGAQRLVHIMRLRTIEEDMATYQSAIVSFSDKYRALPGDMKNATDYWQALNTNVLLGRMTPSVGVSGNGYTSTSGQKTCNGNGDQIIAYYAPNTVNDLAAESFRVWQHLYNAGFLQQSFTGYHGSTGVWDTESGSNVPAGSLAGSAWSVFYIDDFSASGASTNAFFNLTYGNVLSFGAEVDGTPALGPILTPGEAYSIDKKFDDALPASGNITAVLATSGSTQAGCTSADGDSTDLAATYNSTQDGVSCALYFLLPQDVRGPKSMASSPYW